MYKEIYIYIYNIYMCVNMYICMYILGLTRTLTLRKGRVREGRDE